jgi:hypothetical protein
MTIEQGLFKRHFVGRDNFIWWLGQIVDASQWCGNIPGYRTPTTSEHKGFEYRYKVRIMGYHTAAPSELSDEDLPWASVMYPVTAGAGTGGLSQTPNLKQGMFVYGFFLDGEDAQQPIIMGVLGYNQYTAILNDVPDAGFIPFQGYKFSEETVAKYSLRSYKESPEGEQTSGAGGQKNDSINQSVVGDNSLADGGSDQQKTEGQKNHSVPSTSICDKQPLGKIQLEIQELVKDIELAKKSATDWKTKVSTSIEDKQRWIEKRVKDASNAITQSLEWVVTEIEKQTIDRLNNTLKDNYYSLFPNERPKLKQAVETANDLVACLFKKIIQNLYSLVSELLVSAFDKLINIPICFAEQFTAIILGNILNEILSAISTILTTITSIIGKAVDFAVDVLSFVADIFSFLSCDTKPKCPESDVWSPWNGVDKTQTFDIQRLAQQVSEFQNLGVENIIGSITENVANSFSGSPFGGSCNVGAVLCGPPTVDFFGGEGSGVTGNVIVGFAGEIMGVDIITPGGGFSEAPFVKFKDSCGKGSGAVGRAIVLYNPDVKTTGQDTGKEGCTPLSEFSNGTIASVVIEEPGTGYLYASDGSLGGGGRTFANYCETIVRRASGCYDLPYVSGETITLNPGDWVKFPNAVETRVTETQVVTAPSCAEQTAVGESLPIDSEKYPIELIIQDTPIIRPGFNYSVGDRIVSDQQEQFSAEVSKVDSQGGILKIKITNPGAPFVNYPNLTVISNTGFNAKIAPLFSITRLTEEEVKQRAQDGIAVISVVDCVGKIPPKREFDIVPR